MANLTSGQTGISTSGNNVTVSTGGGRTAEISVDQQGNISAKAQISVPTAIGQVGVEVGTSQQGDNTTVSGKVTASIGNVVGNVGVQATSTVSTSPDGNGGKNVTVTNTIAVVANVVGQQVSIGKVSNTQGFNVAPNGFKSTGEENFNDRVQTGA